MVLFLLQRKLEIIFLQFHSYKAFYLRRGRGAIYPLPFLSRHFKFFSPPPLILKKKIHLCYNYSGDRRLIWARSLIYLTSVQILICSLHLIRPGQILNHRFKISGWTVFRPGSYSLKLVPGWDSLAIIIIIIHSL